VEGAELAAVIYGDKYSTIKQYVDILTSTGITWGLLGPREADRVWERHVLNCVALESVVAVGASLVDVGSGAGLPGLPIAIARPDLEVTLLEPLLRRYTFLTETVEALGLGDRVRVERGRAEDCDETFDVVTARAVAPLDRLLGWCTPLFYPAGQLVALKGSSAAQEIRDSRPRLIASHLEAEVRVVRAHALAEPTSAIVVRRAG